MYNANLDTSHPRSIPSLRAKLAEAESSRKRDKDKGRTGQVEELSTKEGLAKYAKNKAEDFDKLRRDIVGRERRTKGKGVETPIEVD
jgi:E3 ubiquitin-protein ligase RAD18